MGTAVILRQDAMGQGDDELGQKILGAFLRKTPILQELETIVLYNTAVKLLCGDSPFVADFKQIEENGVTVLACGTCLDHLGLEPKVGEVSNMDEILAELNAAEKVITL
jgi:hypothetical protein